MAKNKFFSNAVIYAAKSVLFGSMVTVCGLLLVSCAASGPKISEAVRAAPSMDAVSGLNDKLLWIMSHAQTGGQYVVMLDSDYSALTEGGNLTFNKKSGITNVTITIKNNGGNWTISPAHFRVGSGVTLILDNNITLRGPMMENVQGTEPSNDGVVVVASGGTFVMNEGSAIIGNTNNHWTHSGYGIHGGGVNVHTGGAFYMNGGTISGNKCIAGKSLIRATILLKAADKTLANVLAAATGTKCSGCDKPPEYPIPRGGGVYVSGLSNKSYPPGIFVKTGGTITGYDSDSENGNVVMDGGWPTHGLGSASVPYTVSRTGGHAIYFGSSNFDRAYKIVNTTVGPDNCFEFRNGIYKEIGCAKPKEAVVTATPEPTPEPEPAPEPESVDPAVPAVEPLAVEEVVAPELLAALAGAGGEVQEAAPAPQPVQEAAVDPEPPAHKAEAAAVVADETPLPPLRNEPVIAAYVLGAKDHALNKALAARLLVALTNTGRYQALEDYAGFFDHAVKELKNGAALTPANAEQIKGLGERFGADYVCVAEIVPVFGEYRVFAYILRVKTAKIAAKGASDLSIKALADLTATSEQIVESMFKKAQPSQPAAPAVAPVTSIVSADLADKAQSVTPAQSCPPCKEPVIREEAVEEEESKRRSKTGFNIGYGFSGDADILQLGGIHIQPISEKTVSLVAEANLRFGDWNSKFEDYYEKVSYYGINVPLLFRFEKSVVFMETGGFLDALSVKDESAKGMWVTNFGGVLGGGLAFNKGYTQYFYKFNYGTAYYSHVFGIRQLF